MKSFSQLKKERRVGMQVKLIDLCCCLLISLVVYVVLKAGVKDFYTYPSLFSFALFFSAFGVSYLVIAALKKDGLSYFASAFSLVVGLVLFLCTAKINAWIIVVVGVVSLIIAFLSGTAFLSEKLSAPMIAKNECDDYKDYKQRKAEAELEKADEKEEELPEIKSYKD